MSVSGKSCCEWLDVFRFHPVIQFKNEDRMTVMWLRSHQRETLENYGYVGFSSQWTFFSASTGIIDIKQCTNMMLLLVNYKPNVMCFSFIHMLKIFSFRVAPIVSCNSHLISGFCIPGFIEIYISNEITAKLEAQPFFLIGYLNFE